MDNLQAMATKIAQVQQDLNRERTRAQIAIRALDGAFDDIKRQKALYRTVISGLILANCIWYAAWVIKEII